MGRAVAFDAVEHKGGCALLLGLSASRAPRTSGCARFSCPRHAFGDAGWWVNEESVFLMVYRVLDVVREFFLGEGVPDCAARGVADQGQRANVAHLEAAAVALNSRR